MASLAETPTRRPPVTTTAGAAAYRDRIVAALEPGAVGDWIRVRTLKDGSPKGEPMRAKVQRPGLVSLPLP